MVTLDCKPGQSTILSTQEEKYLAEYATEMANRGFGLQSEDLMQTAFTIVKCSGCSHPFHNGIAGRVWLKAFKKHHP